MLLLVADDLATGVPLERSSRIKQAGTVLSRNEEEKDDEDDLFLPSFPFLSVKVDFVGMNYFSNDCSIQWIQSKTHRLKVIKPHLPPALQRALRWVGEGWIVLFLCVVLCCGR